MGEAAAISFSITDTSLEVHILIFGSIFAMITKINCNYPKFIICI